jgi:hypothetical protein
MLLAKLNLRELRRMPDEVCAKFAAKHMRTKQEMPKVLTFARLSPAGL